jgi:hypothetical protein
VHRPPSKFARVTLVVVEGHEDSIVRKCSVKVRHRSHRVEQSAQSVEVQENDRDDRHDVSGRQPDAESCQAAPFFDRRLRIPLEAFTPRTMANSAFSMPAMFRKTEQRQSPAPRWPGCTAVRVRMRILESPCGIATPPSRLAGADSGPSGVKTQWPTLPLRLTGATEG